MKRFDLCILIDNVLEYKKSTFAIILDTDEGKHYNLELWDFENFEGAKLCYLDKKYLRLATENEMKDYQLKFGKYCDKNDNSNIEKKKDLSQELVLIDKKLKSFIDDLKLGGYSNYEYFERIRTDIGEEKKDAKEQLKSSFAITQYANLSKDLEDKLAEIISLC